LSDRFGEASICVYVDADASPVRAEVERVAARHGARVVHVSNGGIRPSAAAHVTMVYVTAGADAADIWIAARAGPGDVVVTADLPLAARAVAAGAAVVEPDGTRLTAADAAS
jgi:uncharacterized protein YaiI (UPF0178 family)